MAVTARFYVFESTKYAGGGEGARRVKLNAVSRGPENKDWAKYSPSGSIELNILNPSAALWFDERVGKDVAITFEDRDPVCDRCKRETPRPALGEPMKESTNYDNEGRAIFLCGREDCESPS